MSHIVKTRTKLYQKAKILISDPKFQQEIKELRGKWNIPQNGFTTNEENQNWHDWIMEVTDKFLDENCIEESKLEMDLSRMKKWKEKEKANQNFNDQTPINAFHIDLDRLVSMYKLPSSWHESIKRYLMFNSVDLMMIPGNVSIAIGVGKERKLMLEINADTTLEDIKFIWPMVKAEQKRLPDKSNKFQPSTMIDIDKKAYELRRQNKLKLSEIADIITEEFNLESYTYKSAGESVKRHIERISRLQA